MIYKVNRFRPASALPPLFIEAGSARDAYEAARRRTNIPVEYRVRHAWCAMAKAMLRRVFA